MTDKHDFKAIDRKIKGLDGVRGGNDEWHIKAAAILATDRETIQTALRLADKLQRGEVSKNMEIVGYKMRTKSKVSELYKAMATQMMKDCENE